MTFLTDTVCKDCGDIFMGDSYRGMGTCSKCIKAQENAAWAAHFAELDRLSTDARIRKLEEYVYNHSKAKPVYVAPPLG